MHAHAHMQVEGKSYRLHSYHLKRASKIFSDMYLLPKSTRAKKHVEGATPLDVKAEDFMNLIWYFYESPYEWYARLPLIKPPLLNLLKDSHRPGSLYFPSQMGVRLAPRLEDQVRLRCGRHCTDARCCLLHGTTSGLSGRDGHSGIPRCCVCGGC